MTTTVKNLLSCTSVHKQVLYGMLWQNYWQPHIWCGAETWSLTMSLSKKINALDLWSLRHILNVH